MPVFKDNFECNKKYRQVDGALKVSGQRLINELLENEYDRFITSEKRGIMDNLFAAIDEYFHPFDFEFQVYEKKNNIRTSGQYLPVVFDRGAQTMTLVNEEEIYRNIIMDRINRMLVNMKYNL